jgi:hypothetical protein
VEPPEADDTPDMADTEFLSPTALPPSALRPPVDAEATSELWMAA